MSKISLKLNFFQKRIHYTTHVLNKMLSCFGAAAPKGLNKNIRVTAFVGDVLTLFRLPETNEAQRIERIHRIYRELDKNGPDRIARVSTQMDNVEIDETLELHHKDAIMLIGENPFSKLEYKANFTEVNNGRIIAGHTLILQCFWMPVCYDTAYEDIEYLIADPYRRMGYEVYLKLDGNNIPFENHAIDRRIIDRVYILSQSLMSKQQIIQKEIMGINKEISVEASEEVSQVIASYL